MGFGASKIDYKERNFTEQPLDDQEIDILLQALPEENVIDSIESEGREKILKAMSDQKVFNIRGDNIFDYYFTNNKDELKSCMSNQFNRDGTPCPDEKFNRMITRIPNLVQGPLREKETEWDTEKTNLKSQYDTLNTEKTNLESQYNTLDEAKTNLQGKYDTLQQKRKQNLDTLALDGFLANSEMYNKMLKEKISQKTLDIFTKDGDINIDVKELLKYMIFSKHGQVAYETRKSALPQLVEQLKTMKTSDLDQFKNKDFADVLIGAGNLIIIYFFYVYLMMKIISQYNSTDKKRVPNETVYNSFSEFFNELGIEEQQFEYALKFIAFNTFKKFMNYESKNNTKGLDIFLKDSLKILEEFIGKEYVNSLSNFDVFPAEEKTFDYVHANVGKPDMSVSQCDCEDYIESKGYSFETIDYKGAPSGCLIYKDDKAGLYNKASTEGLCSSESVDCVQKPPDVKNFVKTSLGNPDFSVSEFECEQYAKSIGKELRTDLTNRLGGCSVGYDTPNSRDKIGMVYYGSKSNNNTCGSKFSSYISDCVKKKPKVKHFQKFTVGKPPLDYKEVTSGKPDRSVSQEECKAYMDSKGYGFTSEDNSGPNGCFVNLKNPDAQKGFYNTISREYDCQGADIPCIQKNPESVSPFECEQYAKSISADSIDLNYNSSSAPKGCFWRKANNSVGFNPSTNTTGKCSDEFQCTLKPMETSRFKEVKDGPNDRTVSEQQCQAYALNKGETFIRQNNENDLPGCYNPSNKNVMYNRNYDNNMNYDCSLKPCVHRPWKEEDYTIVSSGKPLSFYKVVDNNEEPLSSVSEEECKAYADTHGHNYSLDNIKNNNGSCQAWANGVECTKNPSYMWGNCKKACYEKFNPKGCVIRNNDVWFNKKESDKKCGEQSINCIQKNPRYLDEEDCNRYSNTGGKGYTEGMLKMNETQLESFPKGCIRKDNLVGYSPSVNSPALCGHNGYNCIYKALTKEDFKTVSSGKPLSFYKEVTSGKPDRSVSKEECKAYNDKKGRDWSEFSYAERPSGCIIDNGQWTYWNTNSNSNNCATNYKCVQKDPNTKNVSEQQCKAYAIKHNFHDKYDVVEYPNEAPEGCIIRDNVGVRYNKSTCLSKCKCGETNWDCIQLT